MRVLVVGYGSIGKRHVKNLSSFPNTEIIICTKQKNLKINNKYRIFHSLDECIKQNPDAAIISNETSLHVKTAQKLAKAGIHLFIEKPLSNSIHGIQNLLYSVKKKKLTTLIGCDLRFHPCIKKIKEIVSKGQIGRIISVQAESGSYLPDWHPNENYKKSYAARHDLGGGVVLTCIHEIDYLYWFFGDVQQIFSITGRYSDLNISAEDLSAIIIKFKSKIIGEIHLDYFQRPYIRQCKIMGTKGTIHWDSNKNIVKLYDIKKNKWIEEMKLHNYDNNERYVNEIKYFLQCCHNKKKTINPIYEGIKTLKIALAIKTSSQTKRLETL